MSKRTFLSGQFQACRMRRDVADATPYGAAWLNDSDELSRCGHWHRSEAAARACGAKRWTLREREWVDVVMRGATAAVSPRRGAKALGLTAIAIAIAFSPGEARADACFLGVCSGADLPLLGVMAANSAQTLSTLNTSLQQARASYDEIKRMAGIAQEAKDAFEEFRNFNTDLLGEGRDMLDEAFPEVGRIRDEAAHLSAGGRWASNNGELRRMVRVCLTGGDCTEARQALTYSETRTAITTVFGLAPNGVLDAVDSEAAVAVTASAATEGRSTATREYADELMKQCIAKRATGSQAALAACQAAAAAAEIAALEGNANVADGVAQGNRIAAMQLMLESEKRKRDLQEAHERRQVVLDGAKKMTEPPPRIETDGFDLVKEMKL